jgi:uncharacterized protein (TIGR03118 family)
MQRIHGFLLGLFCLSTFFISSAQAQTNSYKQTNLVTADAAITAAHTDSNLINPWGIAFQPGLPFWISDNNAGVSTLYDKNGVASQLFTVPPPTGSSNLSTPTGIVYNATGGFDVVGFSSVFIFATEDGTLSGWYAGNSAILAVNNSAVPSAATGAVYKGLALVTNAQGNFLLATNFRSGKVEVYDSNFHQSQVLGSGAFNDPSLPAVPANSGSPGYAPFGVKVISVNNTSMVVVTYALQDTPMHDPLHIAGAGFVDLFSTDGTMLRRITSDSHLNAPWGVVIPPAGFGSLAGDLLVGNFGDGTINAYNFATGAFIDQMKDQTGAPITNASLWDMVFDPSGTTGDPNTMYITAGLANEAHGVFAKVTPNTTTAAPTGDFSISATPPTMTIAAGQPAMFTVTVAGLNGFNSAVNLSCSGQPINSTCSFSSASVTPSSGGMTTAMMTISTSSLPYSAPQKMAMIPGGGIFAKMLPMVSLAFLGLFLAASFRRGYCAGNRWILSFAGSAALLLVAAWLLTAGGCGYSGGGAGTGTQRGMTTVMITGTSGSLSHSTSVSLTVQ